MKQIVVISGKGGTGKTVLTASFAALAEKKVMADCDVDAADLHLLLQPEIQHREEFRSGFTAKIDQEKCIQCGQCREICRFNAVAKNFIIDPVSCEGCGFCHFACTSKAITMEENLSGQWFISNTRFGPMAHAKLGVAEENSGKLVSLVRNKAKELAEKNNSPWIIIDGSPGIGCPVIASLSGVDCAVVVTEPTLSGLHDAKRVIQVAQHFNVWTKVIINKNDLNLDMALRIEAFCRDHKIGLIGKIPFDKRIVDCVVQGKTVLEHPDKQTAEPFAKIWERLKKIFNS